MKQIESMQIKFKNGLYAIIDKEDYPVFAKYKWFIAKTNNNNYLNYSKYHKGDKPSKLRLHRLILNAPKGYVIDHINGNGLDNRKVNLRVCTTKQNSRNRGLNKNSSSKYIGVHKFRKKWRVGVRLDDKRIYIGYFSSRHAAAVSRDNYLDEHNLEYYRRAFPNKIKKQNLRRWLLAHRNRFMSVFFEKRTKKEDGYVNGILANERISKLSKSVNNKVNRLLLFKDVKKKGYRTVPSDLIYAVKVNGKCYRVI